MKEVTELQYQEALRIVELYEDQQKQKKLSIYEGCTVDNIVRGNEIIYRGRKAFGFWVSIDNKIPEDRDADAIILESGLGGEDAYEIDGGRRFYKNYDEAYKHMVNSFKRKKMIM